MPTNRELEALVEKLSNRIGALEDGKVWEDPKAPEPEPEIDEDALPCPSDFDQREAAYMESIKPYMDIWKEAVEAAFTRLCDRHTGAGGTLTAIRKRKFRQEAEAQTKYDGPPPTYYDYLNEQRAKSQHEQSEERQAARTEGLEAGLYRDPFGVIRTSNTGEVAPID